MSTSLHSSSEKLRKYQLNQATELVKLNACGLEWQLHPNGIPHAIRYESMLINRGRVPAGERGWFRLAAKVAADRTINLLEPESLTHFSQTGSDSCVWKGEVEGLAYCAQLQLHPKSPGWKWTISFENTGPQLIHLKGIIGQDLGLADEGALRNNESYICQYLDHHLEQHPDWGPVLLTRQNMEMTGCTHPWMAQGCSSGAEDVVSDGFQFFGISAKTGSEASFMRPGAPIESGIRQYEFAYAGIESLPLDLKAGEKNQLTFFAQLQPHHPQISAVDDLLSLQEWLQDFQETEPATLPQTHLGPSCNWSTLPLWNGRDMDGKELETYFGPRSDWRRKEMGKNTELHSFFYGEDRHVVLAAKERKSERPHAHMILGGAGAEPDPQAMGTTLYACGIFNAQTYTGSPNFGRFLSVIRDPLNLLRLNGQRIWVNPGKGWKQLGLASAFEMSPRHARWIYRFDSHTIEVKVWSAEKSPGIFLAAKVLKGGDLQFMISHQIVPGENEYDAPISFEKDELQAVITGRPLPPALVLNQIPDFSFMIAASDPKDIRHIHAGLPNPGTDEIPGCVCLETEPVSHMGVILVASHDGESTLLENLQHLREEQHQEFHEASSFRNEQAGGLHLQLNQEPYQGIDEVIPWFAHNARIHFASPHGVEQYNGGAWGVRDVCQGSVEWFLSTGRLAPVRRLLTTVFSQQYTVDPVWPQWFMLDPFRNIQQAHAHGDIPFWPLMALCDYLEASGDYAFLEEKLSYTDTVTFESCGPEESVAEHVERIFQNFEDRCIPDTALVNYGDGDWDDTLQPANPELRSSLVSTWTVALSYHAFRKYRNTCRAAGKQKCAEELNQLLKRIAADFRKHLMPDGITCGFALVEADGTFRPMLHPRDKETGIQYRLLPMVRGILSGLFTPEETDRHLQLIREHLWCPDGVRLMSQPVPYSGGISTRFKRAETASFFGREVGLQYVHAHIRYTEALAKAGRGTEAWEALSIVNPVTVHETVKNAEARQRNCYFSSSDAKFTDRYQALDRFQELRDGTVGVSGGWRIYSSGPGIYLKTLVQNLLGFKEEYGCILLNPVLPDSCDKIRVSLPWRELNLTLEICRLPIGSPMRAPLVNGSSAPWAPDKGNTTGQILPISNFRDFLYSSENLIQIWI